MTLDKETETKRLTEPGDRVKIICLGDSAVGKSKLVERFMVDEYKPQQLSTYALSLYTFDSNLEGNLVKVDIWDTAGQERFQSMHASYYHEASACILVFDALRKVTYRNLTKWYQELKQYRPNIPCSLAVNKIDEDMGATERKYKFAQKHSMPMYFVSASSGANVVKLFRDTIKAAYVYKQNTTDYLDQVLHELEHFDKLEVKEEESDSGEDELDKDSSK